MEWITEWKEKCFKTIPKTKHTKVRRMLIINPYRNRQRAIQEIVSYKLKPR